MRTDTVTFRKRIIRDLVAAGLSSKLARICARQIAASARYAGSPELADDARAVIDINHEDAQSVYVTSNGTVYFVSMPDDRYQPMVQTRATDEQYDLSYQMTELFADLYGESDAPATIAAKALYNDLQARILEINPFVHASVSDPDRYESYHNVHKAIYGFRPRGFVHLDGLIREMAFLARRYGDEAGPIAA